MLRHAAGAVLGGVEDGEVLPDALATRVPVEALGPGIPALDLPHRVKDKDRVVLQTIVKEGGVRAALLKFLDRPGVGTCLRIERIA